MYAILEPYRFVPALNGGHKACFALCQHLAQQAPMYCISTTNNDPNKAPFPMALLFEDVKTKYASPLVAWRLYRHLKAHRPQELILNQPFMAPMLWVICRMLGIRFSIYVHNLEYARFREMGKWWAWGLYPLEWWAYRAADRLFFISDEDERHAQRDLGISPGRCYALPYGTDLQAPPSPQQKREAREQLALRHGLQPDEQLIIFFSDLKYYPNQHALGLMLDHILPELDCRGHAYRLWVCGGGLPADLATRLEQQPRASYLGFVDDLRLYATAADALLNPVIIGGGVKIKAMEALAWGLPVVSGISGARGISAQACGDALLQVPDRDWGAYADALQLLQRQPRSTPPSFYAFYHWQGIIGRLFCLI